MNDNSQSYNIRISTGTLLKIAVFGFGVAALLLLHDLVFVILTAIVIATFIGAAANKINRRFGVNRTFGVVLLYLLSISVFAGAFYLFVPVLIQEISSLLPVITEYLGNSTVVSNAVSSNGQQLTSAIADRADFVDIVEGLRSFIGGVSGSFFETITALFGNVVNVVLIVVISFYLSMEKDGVGEFLQIVTPKKYESYALDLWHRSQKKIAYWLRGQMVLGLIVGSLTFIGLTLLGVEYALLLALIAGLFELIPFGIILAAIPAISFAFLSGGLGSAVLVVALYVLIQQLEGYVFSPLIVQKATGISPLLVILAVLIGAKLAGVWGLVLAVPVAVTLVEVARDAHKRKIA
jgi:predicted PurR-regulated permease PerM